MNIKKGDKVLVLKGRDRGKTAPVINVDSKSGRIKVEGVNVFKRHLRKGTKTGVAGGIVEIISPFHPSKVMLMCPNCNKPTRVGYQVTASGKHRVCKVCKQVIDHAKN